MSLKNDRQSRLVSGVLPEDDPAITAILANQAAIDDSEMVLVDRMFNESPTSFSSPNFASELSPLDINSIRKDVKKILEDAEALKEQQREKEVTMGENKSSPSGGDKNSDRHSTEQLSANPGRKPRKKSRQSSLKHMKKETTKIHGKVRGRPPISGSRETSRSQRRTQQNKKMLPQQEQPVQQRPGQQAQQNNSPESDIRTIGKDAGSLYTNLETISSRKLNAEINENDTLIQVLADEDEPPLEEKPARLRSQAMAPPASSSVQRRKGSSTSFVPSTINPSPAFTYPFYGHRQSHVTANTPVLMPGPDPSPFHEPAPLYGQPSGVSLAAPLAANISLPDRELRCDDCNKYKYCVGCGKYKFEAPLKPDYKGGRACINHEAYNPVQCPKDRVHPSQAPDEYYSRRCPSCNCFEINSRVVNPPRDGFDSKPSRVVEGCPVCAEEAHSERRVVHPIASLIPKHSYRDGERKSHRRMSPCGFEQSVSSEFNEEVRGRPRLGPEVRESDGTYCPQKALFDSQQAFMEDAAWMEPLGSRSRAWTARSEENLPSITTMYRRDQWFRSPALTDEEYQFGRVPGGGMSLRTGEWDRGPRRLVFCQRASPTVANYRKLRPMPGDDLLEPPCWSPLENPELDLRRSDATRVHGQPSELVLVRSEEMLSESRGSIAPSMFEDTRPSSSRSQSRGRWQPRGETTIEPVVLTDKDWTGTTYEGPGGLDPRVQHIWWEQAAPAHQSTSRGRGPQMSSEYDENIAPVIADPRGSHSSARLPRSVSYDSTSGFSRNQDKDPVWNSCKYASREERANLIFREPNRTEDDKRPKFGQFTWSYHNLISPEGDSVSAVRSGKTSGTGSSSVKGSKVYKRKKSLPRTHSGETGASKVKIKKTPRGTRKESSVEGISKTRTNEKPCQIRKERTEDDLSKAKSKEKSSNIRISSIEDDFLLSQPSSRASVLEPEYLTEQNQAEQTRFLEETMNIKDDGTIDPEIPAIPELEKYDATIGQVRDTNFLGTAIKIKDDRSIAREISTAPELQKAEAALQNKSGSYVSLTSETSHTVGRAASKPAVSAAMQALHVANEIPRTTSGFREIEQEELKEHSHENTTPPFQSPRTSETSESSELTGQWKSASPDMDMAAVPIDLTNETETDIAKLIEEFGPDESKPAPGAYAEEAAEPRCEESKESSDGLKEDIPSTQIYFPESRFLIVTALICIIWILFLLLYSSVPHKVNNLPSTTSFPTWPSKGPHGSTAIGTRTPFPVGVYICSTDYCSKEAAYLSSLLSTDVSPCDNFYQYVCENWENSAHIRLNGVGAAVSVDTKLQEHMETTIAEYVLDDKNRDVLSARELYHACRGPRPSAVIELRDMLTTWPVKQWPLSGHSATFHVAHVWAMAGRLVREFGIAALVGVTIGVHPHKNEPCVEFRLPHLLLFRGDDAFDRNILAIFRAAIRQVATEFGAVHLVDEVTSDIMSVLTRLAEIFPSSIDDNYKVITLSALSGDLRNFLSVVFDGILLTNATIILRNPKFFLEQIVQLSNEVSLRALLNYLAFRLIIWFSPLLPSTLDNLRKIFTIEATGRVISPYTSSVLCLLAVGRATPLCLVKAHARLRIARGTDVTSRVWLSQLENVFYRNIRRLAWINGVSDAALRNNLRGHRLARFFPAWALNASQCTASTVTLGNNPVSVFHEVSKRTQLEKLRQVERNARPREPGSTFDTRSRYDVPQRTVYVPLGLVNDSVPGNSTMFAFHLSRVAVRLFSSLVRIASETELLERADSQQLLDDLLGCFARDFQALPGNLRSQPERVVADADDGSYSMMVQAAALRLGFHAFKELLHVQRIWGVNFRLQNLEDTSSEQLFFLYYALDNCERSDEAFKVHEYVREKRLPPHYQVNLPLRHLPEFTEAFQCGQGTAMKLPPDAVCKVFNTS